MLDKSGNIASLYGRHTEQGHHYLEGDLKEVILFFDGDEAGTEATKAIATELKQINEKLTITVVDTPEGEDVNSLSIGHESEHILIEFKRNFTHHVINRN